MRCMEAVIAPLRRQGIRLATYLDDWDEQEAKAHTCVLLRHLLDHGIVINGEKSVLSPARDVVFLGLSLNSMTFMVRLSANQGLLRSCLAVFHDFRQNYSIQFVSSVTRADGVCHPS